MKNLHQVDLNLLVYLDALIQHRNVTRAAEEVGISQPAMSNGLRRLRATFNDPLLVRTSQGMMPTERARLLEPRVREVLSSIEIFMQPTANFDSRNSTRLFRLMASDYAETTLLPQVYKQISQEAPGVRLDVLTPSDIKFEDLEQGKIDLALTHFEEIPESLHLSVLWKDDFSCVVDENHPHAGDFNAQAYAQSRHVWVSKTGMGVATGIDPDDVKKLGWVDQALHAKGLRREIYYYSRHYMSAIQLVIEQNLVATVPTKTTAIAKSLAGLKVLPCPVAIPEIELHVVWSPLFHRNAAHIWLRSLIKDVARRVYQ